jgi:hypothetical protein
MEWPRCYHRNKARIVVMSLFVGGTLVCLETLSIGQEASSDARQACTPDVFRLCREFVPDADRIAICLRQRKNDLSAACRSVMSGSRADKVSDR